MPGFVAVVSRGRRRVEDGDLYALADTYELLRESGVRREARAPFAAAIGFEGNAGTRPVIETDGASWAITVGAVHGPASPLRASLEELDGQFALVTFDAELGRVTIATDPFGHEAVYSAQRNGTTYFCTSALVLARHLRSRTDRHGQLMFLRAGYLVGPVTIWEGIERFEPAVAVTFEQGGAPTRRVYWRPKLDREIARLSFEDAADRYLETLESTCAAYLASRETRWADLTGGYDTRLLNLVLDRVGVDFATNTVGGERSADVRIAAEVARTAGWSWTRLDLPERWSDVLPAMLPLAVAWSDSRLDVLPLAQVLWSHARKAATMPSLIGGGGYEHSRGQAWSQEFWRAARSTDVNFDNLVAMRWLATPVPPGILARDPTEQIRGDLHERARALVEPHRGELNTFQLDLLYAWRNAAHFGAFANAAGCFVETELPAYFKRVFQTSISINPRHRSRHRLGRKLIARLNPEIAAIETTTGGPAEPMRLANVHRFAPYYGTLGRKAAGKVSGKAFGRPLFVATAPADQRVTDGRRSVLEALDLQPGDLRSGGLYNRSGVERLLAAGRRGDSRDGTMLGRIVTLELSLRAADPGTAPPSLSDARERITALLPERGGGA